LNISREGDSTTSLGSLCQCSVTLRGKKFFLMFRQNFLCFSLCPLPLVLSLGTTEKSLAPSSWNPPLSLDHLYWAGEPRTGHSTPDGASLGQSRGEGMTRSKPRADVTGPVHVHYSNVYLFLQRRLHLSTLLHLQLCGCALARVVARTKVSPALQAAEGWELGLPQPACARGPACHGVAAVQLLPYTCSTRVWVVSPHRCEHRV